MQSLQHPRQLQATLPALLLICLPFMLMAKGLGRQNCAVHTDVMAHVSDLASAAQLTCFFAASLQLIGLQPVPAQQPTYGCWAADHLAALSALLDQKRKHGK